MFEKIGKAVVVAAVSAVIMGILCLIVAFPTMWLWNWLMPEIFGLCTINFWQALGLTGLGGLLFGAWTGNSSSSN